MTIREYLMHRRSYEQKQIDKMRDFHHQAWLNHLVTGEKRVGKRTGPVYKTFYDFWDEDRYEQPDSTLQNTKFGQLMFKANDSSERR